MINWQEIERLREDEVAEGLYCEYKEEIPQKFGKHVAAFANSFGGKIYIGIRADKVRNVPTDFPGIDLEKGIQETIKDKIRDTVNPFPEFSIEIVKLPENETRAVIVLTVPESPQPPHVFSDGRIYLRNAVGSDPIYAQDRQAVDRLYDKRERQKQAVELALATTVWASYLKNQERLLKPYVGVPEKHSLSLVCCPTTTRDGLIPYLFDDQTVQHHETELNKVYFSGQLAFYTAKPLQHHLLFHLGNSLTDEGARLLSPRGIVIPRLYHAAMHIYSHGLVEYYCLVDLRDSIYSAVLKDECAKFFKALRLIYNRTEIQLSDVNLMVGVGATEGLRYSNPPFEQQCYQPYVEIKRRLPWADLVSEKETEEIADAIIREFLRCFET